MVGRHRHTDGELADEGRQARRGNRLTVPLLVLVRHVKRNLRRQIRELDLEHLARAPRRCRRRRAGGDATEHEDVLQIVEVGEVRDAVAEIGADRL